MFVLYLYVFFMLSKNKIEHFVYIYIHTITTLQQLVGHINVQKVYIIDLYSVLYFVILKCNSHKIF